jgi:PAS domain S-box-containing protein
MNNSTEQKKNYFAIIQATFVFVVLFGMLLVLVIVYDFSNINLGALAFLIATVCSFLLAKNIYDLADGEEKTKTITKKISENIIDQPSKKLFTEVYNNSPIAYIILDKNGNIISTNKSAIRLLSRTPVSLKGAAFFNCIDTNKTEHLVLIKEKFRNGVVVADEEIEIKRDEGLAWATMSILPFVDSSGQRTSLVTLLDVTKQKEIDTAKSEFVSLASHQLRTPIAGMRWSAELLLMDEAGSLTKQQRRYIDRLLTNIQRMAGLVDDFLQVSRFDLGTRVVESEVVDIQKLIDDVIAEQAVMSSGKKLNIVKSYDNNITEIVTDTNLLRMVITNLYNNAIKYSKNGGDVEISYIREGDELVFSVKDSGMGIPVAEQPRIFSKIFRASNAMKEVPDGTGLGLYIVKKAVQVLRGRVSFKSTENVGTTFVVVIPVAI